MRPAAGRQCDTGAGGWQNVTEAAVHSACLLCCAVEQGGCCLLALFRRRL